MSIVVPLHPKPGASRAAEVMRIEAALKTVAKLTQADECYMPIFDRLLKEHQAAKSRAAKMDAVSIWAAE